MCLTSVESMAIMVYGENQRYEVRFGIFNCMHMVMLMSTNLRKTIESFKALRT
jgi:hypothetical protein